MKRSVCLCYKLRLIRSKVILDIVKALFSGRNYSGASCSEWAWWLLGNTDLLILLQGIHYGNIFQHQEAGNKEQIITRKHQLWLHILNILGIFYLFSIALLLFRSLRNAYKEQRNAKSIAKAIIPSFCEFYVQMVLMYIPQDFKQDDSEDCLPLISLRDPQVGKGPQRWSIGVQLNINRQSS